LESQNLGGEKGEEKKGGGSKSDVVRKGDLKEGPGIAPHTGRRGG